MDTITANQVATKIITPSQLEPGATIPQALDNQYVTDELYAQIALKKLSFQSPHIAEAKTRNAKSEFVRSLLYSSQVVINRAFLTNNKLIYQYYTPGNSEDALHFATFLNQGVIVPCLLTESSIFDEFEFDTASEGERAAQYLMQFITNDIKSVRFSTEEKTNLEKISKFTFNFRSYFARLPLLDDFLRTNMLGELTGGTREILNDDQQQFRNHLKALSRYVEDKFEEKNNVTRNDLYAHFLTIPGTSVSDGHYLAPDADNPYRLELKKLIDLKYNTNLPDMLSRYSFTPTNMPTRSALQDDFMISDIDSDKVESFLDQDLSKLVSGQRRFMANTQRAMILPSLSELTLKEVLELRNLDSWNTFIRLQSTILSDPLSIGNNYDAFQLAFENFQTNLSKWYIQHHDTSAIKNRYESVATIALSIASQTIIYGLYQPDLVTSLASGTFPELIRGISVKLMMSAIDPVTGKINKERSYSIEIMRNELEITENEVKELVHRSCGSIFPLSESLVAEQDRN